MNASREREKHMLAMDISYKETVSAGARPPRVGEKGSSLIGSYMYMQPTYRPERCEHAEPHTRAHVYEEIVASTTQATHKKRKTRMSIKRRMNGKRRVRILPHAQHEGSRVLETCEDNVQETCEYPAS